MTYKEMKNSEILNKSEKELIKFKEDILSSDDNELIKYINYLKYIKLNTDDIFEMKKITVLLSDLRIKELIRNNNHLNFGLSEELIYPIEKKCDDENQIKINNITYNCVSQYHDDFETIYILKDNNQEYITLGGIVYENNNYLYKLPNEEIEYYKKLISATIGTKANILSSVVNSINTPKTFIKEKIDVDFKPKHATKTDIGIMSDIISGVRVTLKQEILLTQPTITKIDEFGGDGDVGLGISLQSNGGVGMMSGDDFSNMLDDIGGIHNLKSKIEADSFANLLVENAEDDGTTDKQKLKDMISDRVRLSDDEFKKKWDKDIDIPTPDNDLELDSFELDDFELDDFKQTNNHQLLYEYKNEDIIIYGNTEGHGINIMDDYCLYNITLNNKEYKYRNDAGGFIDIFKYEDFLKLDEIKNDEDFYDSLDWLDVYLIKNFTGKVVSVIRDCDGNTINPKSVIDEWIHWDERTLDVYIDLNTDNNIELIKLTKNNLKIGIK